MKKIFLSLIMAIVLLGSVFITTGCGKKDGNTIVGSWDHSGFVYTFNKDKTGSYDALGNKMNFTYEDDGKKVSILYTGNTDASSYEYKIEGKKLIIKDSFGNDVEYTRK